MPLTHTQRKYILDLDSSSVTVMTVKHSVYTSYTLLVMYDTNAGERKNIDDSKTLMKVTHRENVSYTLLV